MPSNISPVVTRRQSAMSSLRANATIIVLRVSRRSAKLFTPYKTTPWSIKGRDGRGRDEPASETIGRHSVPRVLRSAAVALLDVRPALMQPLKVRAQRSSPLGRLRPIDLGLLWIAKLDGRSDDSNI